MTEGAELNELVTDTHGRVGKVAVQAGDVKQQHVDQLLFDAVDLLPTQFAEVILKSFDLGPRPCDDVIVSVSDHTPTAFLCI